MSDPADLDDKLYAAVIKAENGASIYHDVANGPELVYVSTESGPIPTVAEWQRVLTEGINENIDVLLAGVTEQADRAESAANLAAAATNPFPTVAEGIQNTSGQGSINRFFSVPGEDGSLATLYRNDNGSPIKIGQSPSIAAVSRLEALIRPNNIPDLIFGVTDPERNSILRLYKGALRLPFVEIRENSGETVIGDREGNVSFKHSSWSSVLGHLTAGYSPRPGLRVIDPEHNVIQDLSQPIESDSPVEVDPFSGGLLFQPVIAITDLYPSVIYPASILTKRDRFSGIVATLTGDYGAAGSVTGSALSTSDMGKNPVLNLRASWAEESRKFMTLNLITAPTQTALPIKVLMIGDSITNRQGPFLLDKYLRQMGCIPQFIGTMHSSASNTSSSSNTGALAEPREGWETGDYTNAITDRSIIIPPGGEAAYLEMSKADQRDRNPFARAAVSGDSPSIVRNGYVVDFAFYQSRFGLDTPDVVVYTPGTNDFRDRQSSAVYDTLLSNDTIMLGQMKAAWPNVKIIRSVPGTSYDAARNDLWEASYAPGIRGMRQAIANVGVTGITLAPLWAMANPEGGYAIPGGSADSDGFVSGSFSDTIHPIGSAREQLYKAMAPFVLAAKLDLI